ncbi:MAG TPA: hypothetical protein VIJ57_00185, partial [Hanamia sp.]
ISLRIILSKSVGIKKRDKEGKQAKREKRFFHFQNGLKKVYNYQADKAHKPIRFLKTLLVSLATPVGPFTQ